MSAGLIGGIGLTHLTVYDGRPGPDGFNGGCAHVHGVTDEAYFVIGGTGAIDLHDLTHGFRRVPLSAGTLVQFGPGTLHRAINDGGLTVLCVMGNSGLPERGDARIWFGPEADADPALYQSLWRLPAEKGLEGAFERRDRSAAAYADLLKLWESDRKAYDRQLARFIEVHAANLVPIREQLESVFAQGPGAWSSTMRERIANLPSLAPATAGDATTTDVPTPLLGMCGLLRPVPSPQPV